ncbi:hypothetical protein LTR97_011756 [Elasticomyces elasticus]|uniref:Uncharacterized protein n=1 Tax=Elasticomyces elasticus TaxID=574655 RepID=A0AAN7ZYE8_9PEZI|nr:hypothetical protein LTR97_011756 [Elasticomyces elasticus]
MSTAYQSLRSASSAAPIPTVTSFAALAAITSATVNPRELQQLFDREGLLYVPHLSHKLKMSTSHHQAIMLGLNGSNSGIEFKPGSPSDSYKFQEMPVTSAFGIPLLMKLLPMPGSSGPHVYEQHFSIDPGPKSPTFGESLLTASTAPATRAILLMRKDGGYLQVDQMISIVTYLVGFVPGQVFREIKRRETAGEICDREVLMKQRLTPRTFGLVFDVVKEDALKQPGKGYWVDVECPVPIASEGDLAESEGNLTAVQRYEGYLADVDTEEPSTILD